MYRQRQLRLAFASPSFVLHLRPPPLVTPYGARIHRQFQRRTRACVRASYTTSVTSSASPLIRLRTLLSQKNLYAFIIPANDPHNSEYSPPSYARRAYVSGFTGSAGTAVVTVDGAYLWTDGRYFLQAEQQLADDWTLMKTGVDDTPGIPEFLAEAVPQGGKVGIDPFVHSVESVNEMREKLEEAGASIVSVDSNLVDSIWKERPAEPMGKVRLHDIKFAGHSAVEKISSLREHAASKGCDHVLFSMLDEVCWVFNVRGDDIPHCPVVLSYGLISMNDARFYVNRAKLTPAIEEKLNEDGVRVLPYDQILTDLEEIATREEKIWLDPASTSLALGDAAGEQALRETTTIPLDKAQKNEAELAGMREAHVRDGVALTSFLCWLEDYVRGGNELSEIEAARKLKEFREAQSGFLSTSFETIPGSGPNGAVIHYMPEEDSCGFVNNREVFLLDSGGQYTDGTTDVTRTMHLGGSATPHEKECYTRVLQGHIAIDTAVFPEKTTGLMLDSLSRVPLWSIGLDFRHGTGHGVGACLNVHEGPHGISPRIGSNKVGLREGMIVSNEPGYYEDGSFGIRIENLLVVVKKGTKHEFGGKAFLGFEKLTFVPIDKDMIEPSLLTEKEVKWLDEYHKEVWDTLSPRMEDGRYKEWLSEKTRPLFANNVEANASRQSESNGAVAQQASVSTNER